MNNNQSKVKLAFSWARMEWGLSKVLVIMGVIAVLFLGPLIAIPEFFPSITEKPQWQTLSTYGSIILWISAMVFFFRAIYLKSFKK